MAGASDANTTRWHNASNPDAFTTDLMGKNGETFSGALLVPTWKSDPSLVKFEHDWESINAFAAESFFKTNHVSKSEKEEFPTDFVPYHRSVTVDPTDVTVISKSADSVTIAAVATEHDNKTRNRVGAELSNGKPEQVDGQRFKVTVTLVSESGAWRVSAISFSKP